MNLPSFKTESSAWHCGKCGQPIAVLRKADDSSFPNELKGKLCLELPNGFYRHSERWEASSKPVEQREGVKEMLADMKADNPNSLPTLDDPKNPIRLAQTVGDDLRTTKPRLFAAQLPATIRCGNSKCRQDNLISSLRSI